MTRQDHMLQGMRWAARVIGLLVSMFLFAILIGEGIAEGWDIAARADMIAGILIGVLGVIGLSGCIISWWRERLAAILLFLTAVGFGIHIGVYAGQNHFLVWSTIGFPYLLAAVLLISSRWLSKEPT